ncbi:hypothetical protein LO80_07700 [Candidatus Francisella endociliophora]|uniref:Lipoprotein n=1 Tax=Candidatus Francisella endociliophora TaxID=653937 RepID=A0A097EQL6_9GAMM|nr:hypothetical protein [Francisella sp. FSC1006]AIT09864.1 hypothetical protein LO80_07700 [Francisella sp. FSC1006]
MSFLKAFSKNTIFITVIAITISSCATGPQKAQELPLLEHKYSTKKTLAYSRFGFDFASTPSGMFNVLDKKPTEFDINIYIGDNQGCKFIYTKDPKGDTEEVTKTESIKGYLSGSNVLLELDCQGKDSNIDYKIVSYANGIEYDKIGNLSYLVESGELE